MTITMRFFLIFKANKKWHKKNEKKKVLCCFITYDAVDWKINKKPPKLLILLQVFRFLKRSKQSRGNILAVFVFIVDYMI